VGLYWLCAIVVLPARHVNEMAIELLRRTETSIPRARAMTRWRGKRPWSSPLADFVDKALDPVLAKQGFGQSDVILHWEEIVGDRLARVSAPLRISWPARGAKHNPVAPAEPGLLELRVEGAFALEIQHLAPIILERVNVHLGWRCVGRLQIRQGPIGLNKPGRVTKGAPDANALEQASLASEKILDEPLRDALTRFGAAVLSNAGGREDKAG
jgi:hypothetical protein